MDGTTLNAKVYAGYAKAALRIGTAHTQYRPSSAITPIAAGNIITPALQASFNIGGQYKNQSKADVWLWQAVLDGSAVAIGDYLVGAETWCIVGMQALMPIIALRCTDTISISRAGTVTQGADGAQQGIVTVASGIPCYVQLKRDKGFSAPSGFQAGATNTSAPLPEWLIYLCMGGVTPMGFIKDGDTITASNGQKWRVDAASSSTVSWQLSCTPYSPDA
jgi:hypothetical protein